MTKCPIAFEVTLRASVVDLELTRVIDGDLVKIMSWYDNEWGYANQMVREARVMASPA